MGREWNNQDLIEYMQRFTEIQRDNVMKEILESRILADFTASPGGRLLISGVVDGIASDVMTIVNLAVSGKSEHIDKISDAASRIGVAHKFMQGLAKIAAKGEDHAGKMKKER